MLTMRRINLFHDTPLRPPCRWLFPHRVLRVKPLVFDLVYEVVFLGPVSRSWLTGIESAQCIHTNIARTATRDVAVAGLTNVDHGKCGAARSQPFLMHRLGAVTLRSQALGARSSTYANVVTGTARWPRRLEV